MRARPATLKAMVAGVHVVILAIVRLTRMIGDRKTRIETHARGRIAERLFRRMESSFWEWRRREDIVHEFNALARAAAGSILMRQRPNWPWPPVWFLCLPWRQPAADGLAIRDLRRMEFHFDVVALRSFATTTSICCCPAPLSKNSFV